MYSVLAPLVPRGLMRVFPASSTLPAWIPSRNSPGALLVLWDRLQGASSTGPPAGTRLRFYSSDDGDSSGEDSSAKPVGDGTGEEESVVDAPAGVASQRKETEGDGRGRKRRRKDREVKEVSGASGDDSGVEESSETSIVPTGPRPENFRQVVAIPLTRRPLFPGFYIPVTLRDSKLAEAVAALKERGTPYVGAFLVKQPRSFQEGGRFTGPLGSSFAAENTEGAGEAEWGQNSTGPRGLDLYRKLHEQGTLAQVMQVTRSLDGETVTMLLMGHRRLRFTEMVEEDPLTVAVEHVKDDPYEADGDMLTATKNEVISTMKELMVLNPLYKEHISMFVQSQGEFNNSRMADFGAAMTTSDEATLQMALEERNVAKRMSLTLLLLKKELELCKLQQTIAKGVEEKISGEQRRYLLLEQLKAIKKELGLEKDDKSTLIGKFEDKLEGFRERCPAHVLQAVEEELAKLQGLESSSSEFNVTRNYLDWLTSLPWGHYSEENFSVQRAQSVLDEDHYGLTDVKERILEFIAVSSLRGTAQGKIICLVGPPGTGKTSIGKSIANALNRKFFRFSVGGLSDVAEIKGHRRTYVGAMPGKMVQCLKATGSSNPLVLIDEIDKLGRGHAGDPASALLELLDPEQNANFVDHYLDVPIDLSKVLFVCTANVLDTIPVPLLDRMEVIRLAGYISDEKFHIARDYLEPTARTSSGVKKDQVEVTDGALKTLIEEYCREAGVRNLQKQIEKIYRKIALILVRRQKSASASKEGPQGAVKAGESNAEPAAVAAGAAKAGPDTGGGSLEAAPPAEQHLGVDGSADSMVADAEAPLQPEESATVLEDTSAAQAASDEAERRKERLVDDSPGSPGKGEEQVAEELIVVDEARLAEYAGNPVFQSDRLYDQTPVGVVMGLAWTSMGGSTLYVETSVVEEEKGKGGLSLTGQLGDVMRESASIAHTVARRILRERNPEGTFFADARLHLHVPAGATPKDGPSAGCTMVTSMLSTATGQAVKPDLAMTGEVTLTGRVLPIGGVKEKVIAARRSGVHTVIFPAANRRDFEELPAHVREGLAAHFVQSYDEIFRLAFEYDETDAELEASTTRQAIVAVD